MVWPALLIGFAKHCVDCGVTPSISLIMCLFSNKGKRTSMGCPLYTSRCVILSPLLRRSRKILRVRPDSTDLVMERARIELVMKPTCHLMQDHVIFLSNTIRIFSSVFFILFYWYMAIFHSSNDWMPSSQILCMWYSVNSWIAQVCAIFFDKLRKFWKSFDRVQ